MESRNLIIALILSQIMAVGAHAQGCHVKPSFWGQEFQTQDGTGFQAIDSCLQRDISLAEKYFNLRISVHIFSDDPFYPNAIFFADQSNWKTFQMFIGRHLIYKEWVKTGNFFILHYSIAHELGHLINLLAGTIKIDDSIQKGEIYADYCAGFLLKEVFSVPEDDVQLIYKFIAQTEFGLNNPLYHCNYNLRHKALSEGYALASITSNKVEENASRFVENLNAAHAFSATAAKSNTGASLIHSYDLALNIEFHAKRTSFKWTNDTTVVFKYVVTIVNKNSEDVAVVYGDMKTGYYLNCVADSKNFVTLAIMPVHFVRVNKMRANMVELFIPAIVSRVEKCPGVMEHEQPMVIDVIPLSTRSADDN